MRKVSKENPLPLHYQLKEIIQEMIENEELLPGQAIPPEREICEFQGVSRMTVNKAILTLVNEGVLYREQGRGTFVSKAKVKQALEHLKGFTEEMSEKGLKADSKILSFSIKEATKKNRELLEMKDDDKLVIEINRLRLLNDEPYSLETVWIPHSLCPDLTKELIDGSSLYKIFKEKYKYSLEKAKQTVEPIILNEYQSELLNLNENSLALLFKRTTYLSDNTPIEHTREIYRSDKYKYEIILK
jgi:GntR family transcriptional regulator